MNQIVILCGKSCSGKDTLAKELLKTGEFVSCVSHTTRPMRSNETDRVDYYFLNDEEFDKMSSEDLFVEFREYKTIQDGEDAIWKYGVSREELVRVLKENNICVVLDLKGARDFIDYCGSKNVLVYYIHTKDKIRIVRARARDINYNGYEYARRNRADKKDFSMHNVRQLTDNILINNRESDIKDNLDIIMRMVNESKDMVTSSN